MTNENLRGLRRELRKLIGETQSTDSTMDIVYSLIDELTRKPTPVDVELVRTCSACPEQYDLFREGRQIGYLRLRHGRYTVTYPDHLGQTVHEAYTHGDGSFEIHERAEHIFEGVVAALEADGVENPSPNYEIPALEEDEPWDSGFLEELVERAKAQKEERSRQQRQQIRQQVSEILGDLGLDPALTQRAIAALEDGELLATEPRNGI